MKIAKGVEMLEIASTNMMGAPNVICPTLIWDERAATLVDAGYPGQAPKIRQAIEQAGVPFERLERVILTHHDIDHIGSLVGLQKERPGQIKILAYETEKAYIDGEKTPLKLGQLEARLDTLSDEMKAIYTRFKDGFERNRPVVDQTLSDGEKLAYGGGTILVIHTPGHTLGHIVLYLEPQKILVAGDALFVVDGRLEMAPASVNFDQDLCRQSLKKLVGYDIETVICYHGGLYQDHPGQRIAALV